jgi:transposase
MKSIDLQNLVLSKYQKGETSSKIFNDLNGSVSLRTIQRWCKMIKEKGTIELRYSSGRSRTSRTKKNIQKVKNRLNRKKKVSVRILAQEMSISKDSVHRILQEDLNCRAYKKRIEPLLTDAQKTKRIQFANWVRNNFQKEDTLRILFSDEKIFDVNGLCNAQNERIWAINREEADMKGGAKKKQKFPQKVMVWLGVCSKGITPLVILDKGTVNHKVYLEKILPVALKYGNQVFGNNWTFQQDGATAHIHHLSQKWCIDNFPAVIEKDHWPPNSPDINPLDYFIWDEFVQQIKWEKVRSKNSLIGELKRAVKRIRLEKVLESCMCWTNRLFRMCEINGNYLH